MREYAILAIRDRILNSVSVAVTREALIALLNELLEEHRGAKIEATESASEKRSDGENYEQRIVGELSSIRKSVPPDSGEEELGHVLRIEAGEPHHLGQCAKCGRTNVVEGERCPSDAGEC